MNLTMTKTYTMKLSEEEFHVLKAVCQMNAERISLTDQVASVVATGSGSGNYPVTKTAIETLTAKVASFV